jgi:hypothetical protein
MHQNLSMAVRSGTKQVNAEFPYCPEFIDEHQNKFDSMMVLLKPSGRLLIGDIPNLSMKKRFLNSSSGKAFHEQYFGQNSYVDTDLNAISFNKMDDSVVIALILRARTAGFHAYLVPQSENLPLSNRREDILIVRP